MGERRQRDRSTAQPVQGTAGPEAARPATSTTASSLLALQRSAGNSATLAHLQRKATGGGESEGAESQSEGLPDSLKAGIERLSGIALDDVRVHYNSVAPKAIAAGAYAQGTEIHVAAGQERHLPHEAWHVVQQ